MDTSTFALPGYDVLTELGRGTTGVVYHGWDTRFNRPVAMKVLCEEPESKHAIRRQRFLREAKALAAMTAKPDPNIPSIYTVGEHRGQAYYVRDFVDGTMLERTASTSSITLKRGLLVLAAIARTLGRVHQKGIVHGGLHSSNVLVATDGTAKLIGFGRASLLDGPVKAPAVDLTALQDLLSWLFRHCAIPFRQNWLGRVYTSYRLRLHYLHNCSPSPFRHRAKIL